jgi:1-deoxy-D-xylulose-5-phosphate reductoisomerase
MNIDSNVHTGTRKLTILGSTGSIGVQTLDVVAQNGSIEIEYLTTNFNIDILAGQIERFRPKGVVIADEHAYQEFKSKYYFQDLTVLCGIEGLLNAATAKESDTVLTALVGFSGLLPTIAAIEAGKAIALANKETLVAAGSIVMRKAKEHNTTIIPVDSEHSAILQCLAGESPESVEKLILTASGGPFQEYSAESFSNITVEQALAHPNWSMGNKITIDSATMMNKGFEVIEAHWLFGLSRPRIEVVVHPQSIVHSLVQFRDGSVKAQLGLPDMRIPISYALSCPMRNEYDFPRMDLTEISTLSFSLPNLNKFPCLRLAYEAMDAGGIMPAALNAANEVAVAAFLAKKINFAQIPVCIERTINKITFIANPSITQIIESNDEARLIAEDEIKEFGIRN